MGERDTLFEGHGRRGLNGGQAVDGRDGLQEGRGVRVVGLFGSGGVGGQQLHFNNQLKRGERGR